MSVTTGVESTPPQAMFGLLLLCVTSELTAEAAARVRESAAGAVDWELLLALAAGHQVRPLLRRSLLQACPERVPEDVMARLDRAYLENCTRSGRLQEETARLLTALQAEGIPAIPLRGSALGELLYGDPLLRESGDIDLLARPHDIARAREVLRSQECRPRDDTPLTARQERALLSLGYYEEFALGSPRISVELHWRLVPRPFGPRAEVPAMWERCRPALISGQRLLLPSQEDCLVMTCLHAFKHLFTRLKWICDIEAALHQWRRGTAGSDGRDEPARAEVAPYAAGGRTPPEAERELLVRSADDFQASRPLLVACLLAHALLRARVPQALLEAARGDRAVSSIVSEVQRHLAAGEWHRTSSPRGWERLSLQLRAIDGVAGRIRFCVRYRAGWATRAQMAQLPFPQSLLSVHWLVQSAHFLRMHYVMTTRALRSAAGRMRVRSLQQLHRVIGLGRRQGPGDGSE